MRGRVTSVWVSKDGDLVLTLKVKRKTEKKIQEAFDEEVSAINKYLNEEVEIELKK